MPNIALAVILGRVGEVIPLRFSFLSRLRDNTGQTLSAPAVASTNVSLMTAASPSLFTSSQATADGFSNDAVLGLFTLLAAGTVYAKFTVTGATPTSTYIGLIEVHISAIP